MGSVRDSRYHGNMNSGDLSELKLLPVLVEQGFSVSIPVDPRSTYDLVVDNGIRLLRIQVKSCGARRRNRYKVDIAWGHPKQPYPPDSIDFYVVHIPAEESWYVIPLRDVEGQKWVSLYPHDQRGKYEKYRNDWQRLRVG